MIAILFVLSWICFDVDMTTGFCWGFCVVNSCSTWYWWAMLTWLVNDNFSFSRSLRASFAVMYCSKEVSQDELAVVVTCLSKLWHSSSSRLKSLKNSQVWCEVQVDKPSNLLLTHHLYKWLTCVSGMSKKRFPITFSCSLVVSRLLQALKNSSCLSLSVLNVLNGVCLWLFGVARSSDLMEHHKQQ